MQSAKWIKPLKRLEIDDLMTAAVYEQRARRMLHASFEISILLMDMPVAMKLRAVFI